MATLDELSRLVGFRKVYVLYWAAQEADPTRVIENWIDQTEKRTWFLFEAARGASNDGH